jgi:hypothetical protein
MTEIDLLWNALVIRPAGLHKLWSLRRQIDVPYACIDRVEHNPELVAAGPEGMRFPGASLFPFTHYRAGTWRFGGDGQPSFWLMSDPEQTIALHLHDFEYGLIVLQVARPAHDVQRISRALREERAAAA